MNEDTTVLGSVHPSTFPHLLNLGKYETYFILRLLLRLFGIIHPIHVNHAVSHAELPLEVEMGEFKNLLLISWHLI